MPKFAEDEETYLWLMAYETVKNGMVELDKPVGHNVGDADLLLVDTMESGMLNPEETCLKHEAYEKLSKEAREVIETILNGPAEIIECFMSVHYDKINKRKIKTYLKANGWNRPTLKKCFAELKLFCSEF